MAGLVNRMRDFARYPKYKEMYLRAFDKMLQKCNERGKLDGEWRMGKTAEEVMHWWLKDGVLPGQLDLLEEGKDI